MNSPSRYTTIPTFVVTLLQSESESAIVSTVSEMLRLCKKKCAWILGHKHTNTNACTVLCTVSLSGTGGTCHLLRLIYVFHQY